jgi:hypothetical protein
MKAPQETDETRDPLTSTEIAADGKLEAFLEETLGPGSGDPLPAEFTERLLSARPFAPWEVRRASVWKGPVLVFSALLLASAGAFVLPLLRLGPGSAVALWAWVTLTALARPVAALVSALRLLPAADALLREAIPARAALALGVAALLSAAATALLALRPGRQAAGAARD